MIGKKILDVPAWVFGGIKIRDELRVGVAVQPRLRVFGELIDFPLAEPELPIDERFTLEQTVFAREIFDEREALQRHREDQHVKTDSHQKRLLAARLEQRNRGDQFE